MLSKKENGAAGGSMVMIIHQKQMLLPEVCTQICKLRSSWGTQLLSVILTGFPRVWYPCCSPGTFLSAWQSPAVVTIRWCTFNHSPATLYMAWPSSCWPQVPGCPLHSQLVCFARNFLSSFEEDVCYLGGSLGN